MVNRTVADNIYTVGTIITANDAPGVKLEIVKYYQRIYYCAVVGEPDGKQLAYYERELIPPSPLNQAQS